MITATLIVKDGERLLEKVLSSLAVFPEVILYDTGSKDRTIEIAKAFKNVRIFHGEFEGFGKTHNKASSLASFDWILSIDADEVVSGALSDEILAEKLEDHALYCLPFCNFFNGKQIKCAGWYPESHIRLYNRKKTSFSESYVHEGVEKRGLKVKKLKHPVLHTPYASISDFLVKMERYSTLFAMQYKHKKSSSPLTAFLHGMGAFLKCYLLKKGCLGGYEGYLISLYNAHTAFYKYLKLYHENKK